MGFGQHLKKLRNAHNFSVAKLAEYMNVDAERMRKWEQRDTEPQGQDLIKIENFFGLPLKEIMRLKSIPQETISNRISNINNVQKNKIEKPEPLYLKMANIIEKTQKQLALKEKLLDDREKRMDLREKLLNEQWEELQKLKKKY